MKFGSVIGAYSGLLALASRWQLAALFAVMLLASLTDAVGLIMLVPLLASIGGEGAASFPGSGWLAEQGLAPPAALLSFEAMLAIFVGLIVLRSVLVSARELLGAQVQYQLVDRLRHTCFSALLRSEWLWLSTTRHADHVNLLSSDIGRVGVGAHFGIGLVTTGVMMATYVGVAIMLSPLITAITLGSGAVLFGLLGRQHRAALNLGQQQGHAARALQATIQDSLGSIKLSKILGNEQRHAQQFSQTMGALRRQQIAFIVSSGRSRALLQAGGAILLVAYLYAGFRITQAPLAELLTLVLVFSRLMPMFMTAQQNLHHLLHALPALITAEDTIARCTAAAEPRDPAAAPPAAINTALELTDVSLTYPNRTAPALRQVSLRFPARTTTAIIGASGAGKSTLADILMGLLPPDTGTLSVDGQTIEHAARIAWRQQVAYVPQDLFLFHDTIRSNLRWACPDTSESEMIEALRKAAAEFVLDLPDGLSTVVGDGGLRLSGGERQRIALARAFLRRPSLLILDEATSALDTDNETRIRAAIEQVHGDLTVVIIGHRLATLEHADQVVLLDQGQVAAQGDWAQIRTLQGADQALI